jgi:hypothetical protein
MFFRLGELLLNMNNVDFIERDYIDAESLYRINISFSSGACCNNGFPTKEEAEKLFQDLLVELDVRDIRED